MSAATSSVTSAVAAAGVSAAAGAERSSGTAAWRLLWAADRRLAVVTTGWVAAGAVLPALVVVALGAVVAAVPGAIEHGMGSPAGGRLIADLVLAALGYAGSLMLDPIGSAIGTAANARITTDLQARLLAAVTGPAGVGHLEDPAVLDRLARAEGSLTGFFPGDAPVTWAGILSSRISGIVGCAVVAVYQWWLGLAILAMWLLARRLVLPAVIRQSTEFRGQTTAMRRAWYLIGVGSKARDAKEVRVFGLGNFLADSFRATYREALDAGRDGLGVLHRGALVGFAVVLAGYAGALAAVAIQAHRGVLDLRSLATVLPMLAVTMSAGSVTFDDITLTWTLAGLPDAQALESDLAPRTGQPAGGGPAAGMPRRGIRFENVGFRYPSGSHDVLAGLDLELTAGASTAIVGRNGTGKSTLVGLLARLRDPTAGRITVDGVDLATLDPASWQRTVAIMPQEPARFPFTAYDNIALGAVEHRDDADGVTEAARRSGFADIVAELPEGWQTVLARELPGGVDLSGGQWQRLALARALFATRHGARLLVLDEPTAALDIRSEARFYGMFFELTRGLTTVVISHRFATVRRADSICVLDGGRITERGSHRELLDAGGAYAQLYRTQAGRFGAP